MVEDWELDKENAKEKVKVDHNKDIKGKLGLLRYSVWRQLCLHKDMKNYTQLRMKRS